MHNRPLSTVGLGFLFEMPITIANETRIDTTTAVGLFFPTLYSADPSRLSAGGRNGELWGPYLQVPHPALDLEWGFLPRKEPECLKGITSSRADLSRAWVERGSIAHFCFAMREDFITREPDTPDRYAYDVVRF